MFRFLCAVFVIAVVSLQSFVCSDLPAQEKTVAPALGQERAIKIVKAEFGSGKAKINCVSRIREIVLQKEAVTTISTPGLKLKNRKGRFRDALRIKYQIGDGAISELTLKNEEKVNIYEAILSHAKAQKKLSGTSDPVLAQTTTTIRLPGTISQIRTGGSGKFLVCQIEGQTSLFVVDVVKKAVVKQIPVSEGVVFAAGEEKLLVGLPMINQLQKWDFATLNREAAVPLDRNALPKFAVMGASSNGPLALWRDGAITLWDINSMSPLNLKGKLQVGSDRYGVGLTVSADGQTLCGWTTGVSGQQFNVMRMVGGLATNRKTDGHSMNERWAMPNPDGSLLLRYGGAAYSYDLKPLPLESFKNKILLPTCDSRFVLALEEPKERKSKKGSYSVTICSSTDFKPVCDAGVFDLVSGSISTTRGRLGMEPAIRFLPREGLFVSIPESRQTIEVKPFSLKKSLDKKKVPYLFAISRPPSVAKTSETFEYQIQALTNSKSVTYQLDMGPKGMTVSSTGKVMWPVNELPTDGVASVVINIGSEDGSTVTHGFAIHVPAETIIRVADGGDSKTGMQENPDSDQASSNLGNQDHATEPNDKGKPQVGHTKKTNSATAAIQGTQQVLSFDEKFTATCFGGAGRFAILHFSDSDEIRVLDLTSRKIVATIAAPDDALIAANKDNLIVVFPTERKFERWSLLSGKKKNTSTFKSSANPTVAAMGTSGDGPLAIWSGGDVQLFDSKSLKPIVSGGPKISAELRYGLEMSVSADGKTFCGWPTEISNQHFSVMKVEGDHTTLAKTPDAHSMNHIWIMPTANGGRFFRFDGKGYKRNLTPVELTESSREIFFPTYDPRFVISSKSQGRDSCQLTVHTTTGLVPIVTLGNLETRAQRGHVARPWRLNSVPRFSFLPAKNLVVYLPHSNDQVVLRTVDLKQSLAKSDPNYLVVTSTPPPAAFVGDLFSYQLESLSASKKVEYSLGSSPDGMKVDENGLVTWTVDSRPKGGVAEAIIKVETKSGASATQAFELAIERKINRKRSIASEVKDFSTAGFAAIDDVRLDLPAKATSITPGLRGRQLMLCQNYLAVLGEDGWSLEEVHLLDKPYRKICERENYYVGISDEPKGIYVLDKSTLEVKKTLALPCRNMIDLVLHPSLPISYVSMRKSFDVPSSLFVKFDEVTGKGKEDKSWVGNWMVMDPSGKHLFVGFKDTYRKGSRLVMNPTQWHVSPEYGSIDWLFRYQLDRRGNPKFESLKERVGANGKGVRISADGKRIVYLSFTGHPAYSKNLSGWDPMDFSSIPNNYVTKDIASCQSFAFHPALPLGASPGSDSVSIYDQETGRLLKDRIKNDSAGIATTIASSLYFSANGKHLIVEGEVNGVHYLQKLDLNLDSKELEQSAKSITSSILLPKERNESRIPLAKIEALAGGSREKLDKASVAKKFKDSVVVVRSGSSSGTGFVVGESGYVMTCAHCIEDADDIELSLVQANGKSQTFRAELLIEDDKKDIALLKINSSKKFHPVQLGVGHVVEMGSPVSVIGNPGAGDVILANTMTQGIVSNPRREIGGVQHIQISAAVNPGNSGGPMFDEYGNVGGMVVLKADIEGAGFAVAANELADFLMSHLAEGDDENAIQRSWYMADGSGPLVATLVHCSGDTVRVKRADDKVEFELKLNELSEMDQTFLKIFTRRNREPNKKQ